MIPYELTRPHHYNELSLYLTDAAFAFSSVGAAAEVMGFTLGSQAGPVGSIAGAIAGNQFHLVVTNPIEGILSNGATAATAAADVFAGNTDYEFTETGLTVTLGEATVTSLVLQGVAGSTPVGVADAAVDAYASAYSHGIDLAPGLPAQSIPALFGWSGRTYSLGPLSVRFGR